MSSTARSAELLFWRASSSLQSVSSNSTTASGSAIQAAWGSLLHTFRVFSGQRIAPAARTCLASTPQAQTRGVHCGGGMAGLLFQHGNLSHAASASPAGFGGAWRACSGGFSMGRRRCWAAPALTRKWMSGTHLNLPGSPKLLSRSRRHLSPVGEAAHTQGNAFTSRGLSYPTGLVRRSPSSAQGFSTAPALLAAAPEPVTEQLFAEHHVSALEATFHEGAAAHPIEPPPRPFVEGKVARITYRSPDSGYTVFRVKATAQAGLPTSVVAPPPVRVARRARASPGLVTVVGPYPNLNVGETLRFEGEWQHHAQYGGQLKAVSCEKIIPEKDDHEGMIAYLAGGALRGVGPVTAKRLVEHFGLGVKEILDGPDAVKQLALCKGIGKITAQRVKKAWDDSQGTRAGVMFLQQHGVPEAMVQRLVQKFGLRTREVVQADPYSALAAAGMTTFPAAEDLARRLNSPADMPGRASAALLHCIGTAAERDGHSYVEWGTLRTAAMRTLHYTGRPWKDESSLLQVAQGMHAAGKLVAESASVPVSPPPSVTPSSPPVPRQTPASSVAASAAESASGTQLDSVARASLKEYLKAELKVRGNYVDAALDHFGAAVLRVLDGRDAVRALQSARGVGPKSASAMKLAWDARADRAPWVPPKGFHIPAGPAPILDPTPAPVPTTAPAAARVEPVLWDDATRCYAPQLYEAELTVTGTLARLAGTPPLEVADGRARLENWIEKYQRLNKVTMSEGQQEAVRLAASQPVLVLTGGPGCGKTFATRTVVQLWRAMGKSVALCAPTGRAAQRLQETTGIPARTIHRLLRYGGNGLGSRSNGDNDDEGEVADSLSLAGHFEYGPDKPLDVDCLLLDEASMMDLPLASALLSALPQDRTVQLVIVGDADQLPPVGPGSVLSAAITAGCVPVIDLREVFRQAAGSGIVAAATAVNAGRVPDLHKTLPMTARQAGAVPGPGDAVWLRVDESAGGQGVEDSLLAAVQHLVRIDPSMDVRRDLQVMSPMRKGPAGTRQLNRRLQALLNPPARHKAELVLQPGVAGSAVFRIGDKVVQCVNNYDHEVYNGDLGEVVEVDSVARRITVCFPPAADKPKDGPRSVAYAGRELREVELAWCVTVHKAQGGECRNVLLALSPQNRPLLSRRLLYTALTRAKQQVVLISTPSALQTAVGTAGDVHRRSRLADRLAAAAAARQLPPARHRVFDSPSNPTPSADLGRPERLPRSFKTGERAKSPPPGVDLEAAASPPEGSNEASSSTTSVRAAGEPASQGSDAGLVVRSVQTESGGMSAELANASAALSSPLPLAEDAAPALEATSHRGGASAGPAPKSRSRRPSSPAVVAAPVGRNPQALGTAPAREMDPQAGVQRQAQSRKLAQAGLVSAPMVAAASRLTKSAAGPSQKPLPPSAELKPGAASLASGQGTSSRSSGGKAEGSGDSAAGRAKRPGGRAAARQGAHRASATRVAGLWYPMGLPVKRKQEVARS